MTSLAFMHRKIGRNHEAVNFQVTIQSYSNSALIHSVGRLYHPECTVWLSYVKKCFLQVLFYPTLRKRKLQACPYAFYIVQYKVQFYNSTTHSN